MVICVNLKKICILSPHRPICANMTPGYVKIRKHKGAVWRRVVICHVFRNRGLFVVDRPWAVTWVVTRKRRYHFFVFHCDLSKRCARKCANLKKIYIIMTSVGLYRVSKKMSHLFEDALLKVGKCYDKLNDIFWYSIPPPTFWYPFHWENCTHDWTAISRDKISEYLKENTHKRTLSHIEKQ